MRTLYLALFITVTTFRGFAQSSTAEYYGPYLFKTGSAQTVFSDTAFVRSSPAADATVQDTLFAFDPVIVLDTTNTLFTVGRKMAPWYRIRYSKAGVSKTGVLWGGALAIKSVRHDGAQFACGVLSYPIRLAATPDDSGIDLRYVATFSIKAKSGTAREECRYNISRESAYFFEESNEDGKTTDTHISPARGIPEGARFLVRFGMSGEACGIPGYTIQAAWDGRHLIRMPMLISNGDGGEWSVEERFVYPSDAGGKPGQLRVKCIEETAVEGTDKMAREIKWRSYRFDAATRTFR